MADYDLKTAEYMLESKRYVYVIFMCHLSIEKVLKAIVCQKTKHSPPRTHDLIALVKIGKIQILEDMMDFVGIINNASIVTRYPEDLSQIVSSYPQKVAKMYLAKTKEVVKCLKRDKRLKK
ncbi:hypothetical protein MNBD_BACTEROID05-1307 [hydrothermal vent metagenome]|uniref:HEPN domain-containing protein n=1 Tax=hydrothermal vent metagenome TaxID=652676 RepID=A0A3B0TP92_9ZZZZ